MGYVDNHERKKFEYIREYNKRKKRIRKIYKKLKTIKKMNNDIIEDGIPTTDFEIWDENLITRGTQK